MELHERLQLAFDRENERRLKAGEVRLTKTMLWKAADTTSSACSHWFNGSNNMDLNNCMKIAPLLRINPLWLFNESRLIDEYVPADNCNETNVEEIDGDYSTQDVPLISWVQAGDWCETISNAEPGDAEDWLNCPVKHSEKTFALRVSGVSMFNSDPYARHTFKDGDIIYVDPSKQPINNSFVVVRLENENKATFKQLIIDGNHRFLRAINPDWPEKIIEIKNNAVICGVVIYKGSEV